MKRRWKRSIVAQILGAERARRMTAIFVDHARRSASSASRSGAGRGIDVGDQRDRSARARHASTSAGTGRPVRQRQVLDPRARQREQRLEQQVQQQVVAADVDDEGDRRPDLRRCRRSSDPARRRCRRRRATAAALDVRQHLQVRALVGDQVVGVEVAPGSDSAAICAGERSCTRGLRLRLWLRRERRAKRHRDSRPQDPAHASGRSRTRVCRCG